MILLAGLISVLLWSGSPSHAQESQARSGLFNHALSVIQNSNWRGTFQSVGPGPTTCYGSLTVRFFPLKTEPFSGGVQTVSYRHHTQFSPLNPFFPFCQTIGASMSVVDLSNCERNAAKKATVENGRNVMVPVRTIIPRNGGTRAVISSPSCVSSGQGGYRLERSEYEVQRLEFTDDRKRDAMKITIGLPGVVVTYDLKRVGR
jgi:hypothetical protein